MDKIKIGIVGYGNIGKGVELSVKNSTDMELVTIFTRRNIHDIQFLTKTKVSAFSQIPNFINKIDVMILCSGSANDLPVHSITISENFCTVDSYDTHSQISSYLKNVDASARYGGNLSVVSTGWDPGLFSMIRVLSEAIMPNGKSYTFWGKGVSQGHSEAIRRLEGVQDAIQYTIPIEETVDLIRSSCSPTLSARQKHKRECFVVPKYGYILDNIEKSIKNMPHYFADYDTEVNFITQQELNEFHSKMPHAGFVFRTGKTNNDNNNLIEFSLKLDSNPEFTASIMTAFARAVYKMRKEGRCGAITPLDIPLRYLSALSDEEIISTI